MKLYYAPGACSLSTHIALRETGLPVTLEKVDLVAGKTETGTDYAAVNPKGYVPALQFEDGAVLTEGAVIARYIADLAPAAELAPKPGSFERVRLEEIMNFIGALAVSGTLRNPMIWLLLLLSAGRLWKGLKTGDATPEGGTPVTPAQRIVMGVAYVSLAALLAWLMALAYVPVARR